MLAIEVAVRLLCVVSSLVEDIPQINQIDEINDETLDHVLDILEERQRFDVIPIIRQTMAGDYSLLEEQERRMEGTLNDFYNDRVETGWPAWCYRMTRNNNPVRQETVSGCQDSGVEDGNVEARPRQHDMPHPSEHRNPGTTGPRVRQETVSGRTESRVEDGNVEARPRQHNMPHPSEHRNPGTTGPRVDQKISSFQRPDEYPGSGGFLRNSLHSGSGPRVPDELPSTEPVFPQPLRPLNNPPPSQCCLCGKHIQATQTSQSVWLRIRNMIIGLSPESRQRFLIEIERYNSSIFNFIHGHTYSSEEVIDDVLPRLRRFYPDGSDGRKCMLCLFNYLFQRSGLSDLADQVKRLNPDRR